MSTMKFNEYNIIILMVITIIKIVMIKIMMIITMAIQIININNSPPKKALKNHDIM